MSSKPQPLTNPGFTPKTGERQLGSQEFLCQEHVDVPDEETLEDVNGVKRKTMHDTWAPPPSPRARLGNGDGDFYSGGLGHLSNKIDGIMGYSCGIKGDISGQN